MVTSQNTPSWWIWAVTKGVEDYSWRVVLVTGGGAQWSRYWAPSLLTYSWSHSRHQRGDTAMWWCFVCASLVTAMAEWPFKMRGTFQAPTHSFISLCLGKEKHTGRLKLNGLPLNPSTSLNQPVYKATFLQHSCLTGLPCPTLQATLSVQTHYFTTACGGVSWWDKQHYQQFWQNEVENSSWKNQANYKQWALLMVLAIIQKQELDIIKVVPSTWDAWIHYILWQLQLTTASTLHLWKPTLERKGEPVSNLIFFFLWQDKQNSLFMQVAQYVISS